MNELTREKILAMPAGRELDRLVALNVMGFEESKMDSKLVRKGARAYVVEPYSTYIPAAWEVVEKFETIEIKRFHTDKGLWFCEIKDKIWHRSYGTTAPEAICKAALLAVMGL